MHARRRAPLRDERLNPGCQTIIKFERLLRRRGHSSGRVTSGSPFERVPKLDPVQPIVTTPPGLVGGSSRTAGTTPRRRGGTRDGRMRRSSQARVSRLAMTPARAEARTPKIPGPKGNRRPQGNPRNEDLIKKRKIVRNRTSRVRLGIGLNKGWPTRRAPPSEPSGKDAVAYPTDSTPHVVEPIHGQVTLKEPTKMTIAVTLHRTERGPASRRMRTVIRATSDRAAAATIGGGKSLGARSLG